MTSPICNKRHSPYHSDFSNSSWAEMETLIIGNVQIYPPTLATKQMFILKYLTPMGEYQEVRIDFVFVRFVQVKANGCFRVNCLLNVLSSFSF